MLRVDSTKTGSGGAAIRLLAYADSGESFGAEAVFIDVVAAAASIANVHVTAAVSADNRLLRHAVGAIDGIEVIEVPRQRTRIAPMWLWDPRRGLQVRRLLGARAWDIVLINLPGVEYGSAPMIWARRGHAVLVGIIHLHQSVKATGGGRRLARTRDRLTGLVLRRLDHAWLISPNGAEEAARTWGLDSDICSVLPLIARRPERVARERARTLLGLPGDRRIVGILGRIEVAQKGHDVFVQAAVRLAQWDPDMLFAVVGDGPDRQLVARLVAAADLTERFSFLGTVRPLDLVFGAIDAIAIPSRFEGLPLIALEAIGASLPGVASRVDGLGWIWPPAWTVEPGDAAALAERLREVLDCPVDRRQDLLREAQARAARCLTDDLPIELEARIRNMIRRRSTTE